MKYVYALEIINLIFTTIFLFEAIVKIVGLGIIGYFSKGWNKFDFIVVLCSVVEYSISYFLNVTFEILRVGP